MQLIISRYTRNNSHDQVDADIIAARKNKWKGLCICLGTYTGNLDRLFVDFKKDYRVSVKSDLLKVLPIEHIRELCATIRPDIRIDLIDKNKEGHIVCWDTSSLDKKCERDLMYEVAKILYYVFEQRN